ncbi:Anoctamin-5 [Podila epigama]|nr:Anoctamin-5 [Podila epigama]
MSIRSKGSRRSSLRRAAGLSAADQTTDDQNLKVITRRMSSYRVVHLLYQTDADLFDAIQQWKEEHPGMWVDHAIDAFADAKGADALAQLVYSTEAFDIILKYNSTRADLAHIFNHQPKNDRSHWSPSQMSHREDSEHTKTTATLKDTVPGTTDSIQNDSAFNTQRNFVADSGPCPHGGSDKHQSRLSHLRSSSSNLLSRAFSLGASRNRKVHTPTDSHHGTLGLKRSNSLPHITVAITSPVVNDSFSPQPLPPPFLSAPDCSTDLFPSPQASTIVPEQTQRQTMSSATMANQGLESNITLSPLPRDGPLGDNNHDDQQQSNHHHDHHHHHRLRRRGNMPSKAKLREWKIQLHRQDYQLALLKQGVFIELEKSIDSKAVYVKVLAPFWRLEEEAQRTHCKADLAKSLLPSIPYASRIFPSISRLFPCLEQSGLEQRREAVLFKKSQLNEYHLAEPGRKWSDIVRHAGAINSKGQHMGSHCGSDARPGFFQTSRRGYLVNSIMMRTDSRNNTNGRKMGLRSALRRGAYQKLYALHDGPARSDSRSPHDANYRDQLRVKWAKRFWRNQPLDLVNAYFGERIGVYFAWLGHYTQWLTIPAAVGIAVFVFGIINTARLKKLDATPNALFAIFDNVLTMPFALFMSIWSTVYIEFWKRANQYYAYRWNMMDYERVELPRTEFRATRVRYSAVTGKKELYYPMYWKALRIFASSVAVFLAVCVVIGSVACLMIFKAWCRNHVAGPYVSVIATAMLNLIIIIILGEIWCRLAEWLTDKENHKYTDSYEDSLIIKRYLFDFTNMYATLFYYAFFKAPFGRKIFIHKPDLQDECLYDACITELSVQLAVVFIGKQFLNALFEMVFPWIERTWNRKKILAEQALKSRQYHESRKRTRAPEWVKDDDLPSYQGRILKCYRKTVIQFGFCTLFVTSFPVAPAFALVNNWIDIRLEAYRLLTQYQRPIALRAQDIGMWEKIMEFVSFTSVITNASIIAFSSLWIKQNLFVKYLHANQEGELLAARLGFILVFEHVVFLFKIILRSSIPSVPLTIKLAVERSKHLNRVANSGQQDLSELDEDLDMYSTSESEGEDGDGDDDEDEEDEGERDSGSFGAGRNGDSFLGPELGRVHSDIPAHGISLHDDSGSRPVAQRSKTWVPTFSMLRKNSVKETLQGRQAQPPQNPRELQEEVEIRRRESGKQRSSEALRPDASYLPTVAEYPSYKTSPQSNGHNSNSSSQGSEKVLHHRQSLTRPTPQRVNTEMDGEWVVLDEPHV